MSHDLFLNVFLANLTSSRVSSIKVYSSIFFTPATAEELDGAFREVADHGEDELPNQAPPEELSKKAVENRLRRVMKPRADGSLLIPPEIVAQYKDLSSRDKVMALFEKCGYSSDKGTKTCVSWIFNHTHPLLGQWQSLDPFPSSKASAPKGCLCSQDPAALSRDQ